jgi:hypothetical protein
MAISKRILNKRNRQRSRKGGVITKVYTPPTMNNPRPIIVVMTKLAGDVPTFADTLSSNYGNAPVYFAWCPFNIMRLDKGGGGQDIEVDLTSPNIERLRDNWLNVDHTDKDHSKILERWCGVSTDPLNSTECIKYVNSLTKKEWPSFTDPTVELPISGNPYKNGMLISEFYMKRVATVLYYDRPTINAPIESTHFFTNFLYKHTNPAQGNNNSLETAYNDLLNSLSSTNNKVEVLKAWTKKYANKFSIYFNNLDPDKMTEFVFSELFSPIYTSLMGKDNVDKARISKFDKKLTTQDLNTSYSALFEALEIKEIATGKPIEAFRLDNFFKFWIDGIPKELPLVTTDGCVAMAVLAIDIYNTNPVEEITQKEYMVEMSAFDKYGLLEWSAKLLREKLFSERSLDDIKRQPTHVHVIVDMESDDLLALRIFANFYTHMTVYIASNSPDSTTQDALFMKAKNYLDKNKPSNITIYNKPVFCDKNSPNRTKIKEHYTELNKANPITEMTEIITLLSSDSVNTGGKAKQRNSIKRRKSSKRRNSRKRRKSRN